MGILDDLLASLTGDCAVRHVLVGAHLTAVCSSRCGLAATVIDDRPHQRKVRDAGRLHLKSARELAEYARSDNPTEASIGVAAINSLIVVDETATTPINAFDLIARPGAGKCVAVVGSFPFVPRLRDLVGELLVIERRPSDGEYPASAADTLIPRAEVVALTASALINHTLDHLLSLCTPGAFVVVLGPTAPLSHVLFEHGATAVAGSIVTDEAGAIRAIGQGSSFRQLPGIRLATMTVGPHGHGVHGHARV